MPKKTTTLYVREIDDDYMQIVKEFALHRRMSLKALVLAAIDEYMVRNKAKESKPKKEARPHDKRQK